MITRKRRGDAQRGDAQRGDAEDFGGPRGDKESLDALVRRVDPDRWLSTRFAPPVARRRLIALYAVNYEIARTAEIVTEPALGDIRLRWWGDQIAGMARGASPEPHPALVALSEATQATPAALEPLSALVDARGADFAVEPFDSWADLEAYVDATAGGLITAAARLCGPDAAYPARAEAGMRAAGRAWGLCGLARAAPIWAARGRSFYPRRLLAHIEAPLAEVLADPMGRRAWIALAAVIDRAEGALREAARASHLAPAEVFPAFSYVALAASDLRALKREGAFGARPKPHDALVRRARLVAATATGAL